MAETNPPEPAIVPLGQRLLDSPFLLLATGLVVMIVFYTLWGMIEIVRLPKATLP